MKRPLLAVVTNSYKPGVPWHMNIKDPKKVKLYKMLAKKSPYIKIKQVKQ